MKDRTVKILEVIYLLFVLALIIFGIVTGLFTKGG